MHGCDAVRFGNVAVGMPWDPAWRRVQRRCIVGLNVGFCAVVALGVSTMVYKRRQAAARAAASGGDRSPNVYPGDFTRDLQRDFALDIRPVGPQVVFKPGLDAMLHQQRDGNGAALPKTNDWTRAAGTPYFFSARENLYFHPPTHQFYDPTNDIWYDPNDEEWYGAEE
jgi:hypothetical protein